MRRGDIFAAAIFIAWLVFVLGYVCPRLERHINPCTANIAHCYSIQGLYSYPDCPGQKPWHIEVDDQIFFMGCNNAGD